MMTGATALERPVRRLSWTTSPRPDSSIEWMVANGLGGYASGPVAGGLTRRFHGLLVAALPAPLGRMLYLTHLNACALVGDRRVWIDRERVDLLASPDTAVISDFSLENGLPVWHYSSEGIRLEKRVFMPFQQNTTHVIYRVLEAQAPIRLELAPLFHVRPHEGLVAGLTRPLGVRALGDEVEVEIATDLPLMRWLVSGAPATFAFETASEYAVEYDVERTRGYDHAGGLWSPGTIALDLAPGGEVAFSVSTELWARLRDRSPSAALDIEMARRDALVRQAPSAGADPIVAELALAADQFLVSPAIRAEEVAEARASGEEPRTVIAGYPWFTDWGRDTMISLEGLTLDTGRNREARRLLQTFAHHVRDGLIPNLFPEGERAGLYHTADATLWFLHAVDRYTTRTADRSLATEIVPVLLEIIERHLEGTRFGIGVDPADGLLRQGEPSYQLTWMDAKVGDWVVTPRRGKAVEINALWYNALHVAADVFDANGHSPTAALCRTAAAQARASFNRRFWNPAVGHLYDVIDGEHGDDAACRPNQILAISLPRPILDREHWTSVLDVVQRQLLTPVGLRSLAPGHPEYQQKYFGDLRSRDASYHQGTVWAWLIGPFVDAWLCVHGSDHASARRLLDGFLPHLNEACVGSISEIFDAEEPFTPRGCFAQAWSVAEVLRAWVKTAS
jgi:predicted glycogen debranching enzyme